MARLRFMHGTLALASVGLGLAIGLQACAPKPETLSGAMTADNAFYAYLSTSPTERGMLIASGDDWHTVVKIAPAALDPAHTYYLHIEAINYGDQGALIGDFKLSGDRFHFADGRRELLTGPSNWTAGFNSPNSEVAQQPWVAPKDGAVSQGANGASPWGDVDGVGSKALWVWPNDDASAPSGPSTACSSCTVDFSATIVPSRAGG